jgi:alpha-mannosidase
MNSIANKTVRDWRFSMEDIRCALPWGEKTLQKIARQVRSAENRLITAEKLASLAAVWAATPYPASSLQEAWDKTLWSQHHDVWITATTRSGRDAWAFQAAAETWDSEAICNGIIERSLDQLVGRKESEGSSQQAENIIHVFNSLAHQRTAVVELELATNIGTRSVRVLDAAGKEVVSQFETTRKYLAESADRVRGNRSSELKPDESIGAGRLLFSAAVPSTGHALYRVETYVEPSQRSSSNAGAAIATSPEGAIVMETDLYKLQIEPAKGGIVSSLYAKQLQKEFCVAGNRKFHEFRGYFIEDKAWQSSSDNPASIEVLERGPLRLTVAITGRVSSVPFRTSISISQGQRRIDFHTQFHFEKDTWIGDPWEIAPAQRMTGRRRSEYDDRYKLLALFPTNFQQQAIYKNSAFDVCRSTNSDTFFGSWDTIKHNIILNWVDLFDGASDTGLAILNDGTTSYAHGPEHPLSLVLGWGWEGGFWWGKCPLSGLQEAQYALVPHRGLWDQTALWRETAEWSEPLLTRLAPEHVNQPGSQPGRSLLEMDDPGLQLSAMTVKDRDLLVRLFNADGEGDEHEIRFGVRVSAIDLIELDGRPAGALTLSGKSSAGCKVRLKIPRFGIKTLRLKNAIALT